ncbi:MAG: DegV family EDD domain-containing protein [Micromonosporaceae bacterium]|nr:DegV family EDD domain-containing protein [Micromonosporaceae bacterium]
MSHQRNGRIAVVTDSTASLPNELVERHGVHVVPLHVIIDGVSAKEGVEVLPIQVARAFGERRGRVTTSRPTPGEFSEVYAELLREADGVVSVHVSGKLSGTVEAAQLAAEGFADRVTVIDSCSTGMGLGFPALAAAEAAASGADLAEARRAVEEAVARTSVLFYVDTLEFLRRGGRIGAGEALLGTALAVKPILHVADGEVLVKEKVRTAGRALARIEDLSLSAAGAGPVDIAVHHLDSARRAADVIDHLSSKLPELREAHTSEVSAAVGAHVGPGLVGVVVHRRA